MGPGRIALHGAAPQTIFSGRNPGWVLGETAEMKADTAADRTRRRVLFRLAGAAAGAAAFLAFRALSASPDLAEKVYSGGTGPLIASILSRATGWIPFSLAEIVIALFLVRQIRALSWGLYSIRVRKLNPARVLGGGLLHLARDAGIIVAALYATWGFNYARPALEERKVWKVGGAEIQELTLLALDMVDAANEEYVALHESVDVGAPTKAALDRGALTESLEMGWQQAARLLREAALGKGYGAPKPLLASRLLDYLGIAGFYFPFTGEAYYNRGAPPESLPTILGHEMAHQRGYAREDEANFMGFLAAALSPHPWPRYSAALFAQRQLIAAIGSTDPERARELQERRHPGVRRDLEDSAAYWARFEGPAQRAAEKVNDAYLKSQKVPGGIHSYARSVELLVGYARANEGALPRGGAIAR